TWGNGALPAHRRTPGASPPAAGVEAGSKARRGVGLYAVDRNGIGGFGEFLKIEHAVRLLTQLEPALAVRAWKSLQQLIVFHHSTSPIDCPRCRSRIPLEGSLAEKLGMRQVWTTLWQSL